MSLPNRDVFADIYQRRAWGPFASGTGSIQFLNRPFAGFVNGFLEKRPDIRTVVEIGFGTWSISRHLDLEGRRYVGCEVVPSLVRAAQERFASPDRQFLELDASTDDLPAGDLIILKDVLMHLPNDAVSRVLSKLDTYRYVIIQNNIEEGALQADDIPPGRYRPLDIRKAPFRKAEYLLAGTYTLWTKALINPLRRLRGSPRLAKGIFVRENSARPGEPLSPNQP